MRAVSPPAQLQQLPPAQLQQLQCSFSDVTLRTSLALGSSTNAARQPREGTRAVGAPFLTE